MNLRKKAKRYKKLYESMNNEEKDNTNYKMIFDRLYNWLNDMKFAIAPDETITDEADRHDRLLQIDLIDELMEWMIEQEGLSNGKN